MSNHRPAPPSPVGALLLLVTTAQVLAADAPAGYDEGKKIFTIHCASCHQENGGGVAGSFPPLAANEALQHQEYAAAVVLQGMNAEKCAICHGDQGQGTPVRNGKGYQFPPPLWGPHSHNWGAGMHRASHFAAFIKHNMPLGQPGILSDQDAWDIAYWVDGEQHRRPTRVHNPGQPPLF